jgi:hypothetical protein
VIPIPFHQEIDIPYLNFEITNLESTESVDSAHVATVTSFKDWCDIQSAGVSVRRDLSSLLSPVRAREQREQRVSEKVLKTQAAFQKYYEQGKPRKSDHQTELMKLFARFDISSYNTSSATKPRAIPQLNPASISGQSSLVRLGHG